METKEIKQIAKEIYNDIFESGLSTDYCYMPNYKEVCKEKAMNKAKRLYPNYILEFKNEINSIK